MRDGEDEPLPRYAGPFVVIDRNGLAYIVGIEPVLPCGAGKPRTFGSKHEAFGAARALWTDHHLPLRDLTVGETARAHREE